MTTEQETIRELTEKILERIIELTDMEEIAWIYGTQCSHSGVGFLTGFYQNFQIETNLYPWNPVTVRFRNNPKKSPVVLIMEKEYKNGQLRDLHRNLTLVVIKREYPGTPHPSFNGEPLKITGRKISKKRQIKKLEEVLKKL